MYGLHHRVAAVFCVIGALVLGATTPMPTAAQETEECLTTAKGAPLKVIVRQDTALHEHADDQSPSQPVRVFDWFYAMPAGGAEQKAKNGFYCVATAPRKDAIVGFIKETTLVEWPHREVCAFRPAADREPLAFYSTLDDIKAAYSGSTDGGAPQPLSREPRNHQGGLMPLLDEQTIEVNGEKLTVYRLAYLQGPPGNHATPVASEGNQAGVRRSITREGLQEEFTLDLCFVIDTTASMEPFIDAVKAVVSQVVAAIDGDRDLAGRVRFGLVAYRDVIAGSGIEYLTKTVCDLPTGQDHAEFQQRLASVHEAPVGSEDYTEDVLAGLHVAITEAGWNPQGYKTILLIGDASAHIESDGPKNPGRLTIPGVIAEAQPAGSEAVWQQIVIHGLRIFGADLSDHALCRDHFTLLTAGRDYPGLHYEFKGLEDAPRFVTELIATLKAMTRVTGQVARGEFEELEQDARAATPGSIEERMLGPVLEMVRASEGADGTGPTFASGYACYVDTKGNQALEAEVMVSKGRLSVFQAALDYSVKVLDASGDPGSKDVGRIVKDLQVITAGIATGETIDADTPLTKLFGLLGGFPVRSPIFNLTPRRLAAMTAADYEAWRNQVRGVEGIIKAHLDKPTLWIQLGTKAVRDGDRVAFIKVSDLP